MTPDDLRARLPVVGAADPGPSGHVILDRRELPDGSTAIQSLAPEALASLFDGVDLADRAAAIAADRRKARVDRPNGRRYLARPDGTFDADAPALNPDDVVEEQIDLGYAEHLARWHDEGRLS